MIISDGAPVDDSTISANSSNYLEKHLKKVIKFIENKTNIEIIAIGIGHNVNKYYKKAVTINDPDQLGGTMIKKFLDLGMQPLANKYLKKRDLKKKKGKFLSFGIRF